MTRDPIRRRYGHGAARLPLGLPPETERLSERARKPVPHERRLTLVLPAIAAAVALLIGSILQPPGRGVPASVEPIQIVLETKPIGPLAERTLVERPASEAVVAKPRSTVDPRREPPPSRALAQHSKRVPSARPGAAEIAPASEKAFDVADLETRAPTFADEPVLDDPPVAASTSSSRTSALRSSQASTSQTMPTGLAGAQHAPGDVTDFASNAPPVPDFDAVGERRPQAGGGGGGTSGTGAARATAGRGDAERRDFLAAMDRDGEGHGGSRAGAAPSSRRPEVSAARASMPSLSSGTNRFGGEGWEEVPLDALPDCDPPGRQDLLKKRILLAAPFQRECSHPGGSFRFVETRSLGAFLMWSRPNPDARAGKTKDRDACDVLERALACIGDLPSQESTTR
jgi:hypothetical protein